jgi:hypothetical protein
MQTDNNRLFRSQVTEHATRRLYGDVLVAPKRSQLILTFIFVIWSLALLYAFVALEWTQQERVEGRIEREPQTNQLIAGIYIPVDVRGFINPSQSFQAIAGGEALHTAVQLTVKRISAAVITDCPVCSVADGHSLYVRAEAEVGNPSIVVGDTTLQLAPGVRLSFMLPTRRQTLWDWASSRGATGQAPL